MLEGALLTNLSASKDKVCKMLAEFRLQLISFARLL